MPVQKKVIHRDGTEKTFSSPSYDGTFLYFTSKGDNIETGEIGKGSPLTISNEEGEFNKIVECQFIDDVFLKDGFVFWENATFGEKVSLEIVLPANQPMPADLLDGNASLINGVVTYITASQSPDETWTGEYFLFPFDYTVNRFVNEAHIIGTNHHGLILESSDIALIPSIFKFRFTYGNDNDTANSDIKLIITLELYRYKTT